jgi:hypothetical protein
MEFYVYVLIDPRTGKVFYVGKGKTNRMYEHVADSLKKRHHNKHLQNKILKIIAAGLSINYEKVFISKDETETFKMEMETIKYFGIKNLCNKTEGGEGSTGYKHTQKALQKMKAFVSKRDWNGEKNPNYGGGNWTEESKRKFSEYQKTNLLGEKNPFFGKNHNDKAKEKMSEYHSGKILTDEHKNKIRENHAFKGRKRPDHSLKMSGEKNPKAKLTSVQVKLIREKYKTGTTSYSKLAIEYSLDKSTIADIINEKIWRTQ